MLTSLRELEELLEVEEGEDVRELLETTRAHS
jgi:hypothetical protein